MVAGEITESVLALPENERLDLARQIIESINADRNLMGAVSEGVRRIEDIVSGKTCGLSEDEYRAAVG